MDQIRAMQLVCTRCQQLFSTCACTELSFPTHHRWVYSTPDELETFWATGVEPDHQARLNSWQVDTPTNNKKKGR